MLDNDWPVVIRNLRRSRQKWVRLPQVLGWEGADMRISGMFYTVVVQLVLLYGVELWFMSPYIGKAMGDFHHWVIRRLVGWIPQ